MKKSARLASVRADERPALRGAAGDVTISPLPVARRPLARGSAVWADVDIFDEAAARAIARRFKKKTGFSARMDVPKLVERLNQLPALYWTAAGLKEGATAAEYFDYAKAVAQHSQALLGLLGDPPLDLAVRESLFHRGPPRDDGEVDLDMDATMEAIEEDIETQRRVLKAIADTVGGLCILHATAALAASQWKEDVRTNRGKIHVRALVQAIGAVHVDAAGGSELPRQPSADAPVVDFCRFVILIMFSRTARRIVGRRPATSARSISQAKLSWYRKQLPARLDDLRELPTKSAATRVAHYFRHREKGRQGSTN